MTLSATRRLSEWLLPGTLAAAPTLAGSARAKLPDPELSLRAFPETLPRTTTPVAIQVTAVESSGPVPEAYAEVTIVGDADPADHLGPARVALSGLASPAIRTQAVLKVGYQINFVL